jgi:hypothetical protein
LELTQLKQHAESVEYGACSFELAGQKIEYRRSKITPTKAGQFVTIWKRNKDGNTAPFDIADDFDFIIITSIKGEQTGQFIFPKTVLADKGIIAGNGKHGKRGMRVYPTWDIAPNNQANQTQQWQTKYFVEIKTNNTTDINLIRKLLNETAPPKTLPSSKS